MEFNPIDLLIYHKGARKDGQHSASLGDVTEITNKAASPNYFFRRLQ